VHCTLKTEDERQPGEEPTPGGSGGGEGGTAPQSAAGTGGGSNTTGSADPSPEAIEPGELKSCSSGGPDSDLSVFVYTDVTDTTIELRGTVTGAVGDGAYYVSGASGSIDGPVETSGGAFGLTLPLFCGEQTVKLVWSDANCKLTTVTHVTRVECSEEDVRLTLSWDDLGADFELHLIKPGGRINDSATDCTWTSCVSGSPDWGNVGDESDDPRKDVDDTNSFGPENIYYSSPEPGTYTVLVEHWGSGSPEADGQVIFNVEGRSTTARIQNLPSRSVWTAGTISWPSGEVALTQDVYDCSGSWASGCQEMLPRQ
jgi:uncharacterized protein YfaP (DUF2135 family)